MLFNVIEQHEIFGMTFVEGDTLLCIKKIEVLKLTTEFDIL
jgi:hypothetical protein